MKVTLINAQQSHLMGHINKHLANIEVLLNNPVGIGEHQDIGTAIEEELKSKGSIASSQLQMVDSDTIFPTLERLKLVQLKVEL